MKKNVHLTVRLALKHYKRYQRKYRKLSSSGMVKTDKLEFLKKRMLRLKEFLRASFRKTRLATAAGALTLAFTTTSAEAQTFNAAVMNPFGLSSVDGFHAPAFADLDNDGDLDMITGDNYYGSFTYFENTGSATAPAFAAGMVNPFGLGDIGSYNTPTFADLDGDGDFDMMVGSNNSSYSYANGDIYYYENTGTATAPAFAAPQTNPFGITLPTYMSYGYTYSYASYSDPDLADLDGDGDLDLLVGNDGNGTLYYYENTGTSTAPAFAAPVGDPFGMTTFDNAITPSLVDFDGDGDLDLFAGEGNGSTYYLENTGTSTAPAFGPEALDPFTALSSVGYYSNVEVVDIDNDGDLDIFSGASYGDVYFFEQVICTPPAAPTDATPTANLTVCEGSTTTLEATGTGTISWYDAATGGTYLGSGATFTTPALAAGTVTYFAQDSTCAESVSRTSVTVTVNALPTVGITVTGGTTVCEGETITLTGTGALTYVWAGGPSTDVYTVTPMVTNTYSVTGTDANGCENSAMQLITVNALPDVSTTSSGATITATLTGATSYQWVTCPAYTTAPGTSTSQSYTATGNGDYAVIITDGGCSDTSTCVTINTVGLQEFDNTTSLSVYPNPSNGSFTIQSPVSGKFVLQNDLGQTIQTIDLNAGNANTVRIEGLNSGVYFITGINNEAIARYKIVVTK